MNLLIDFNVFLKFAHFRRAPIHGAAFGDHTGCIKILLDNNADPNNRDKKVSDDSGYPQGCRDYARNCCNVNCNCIII